jgi:hypothetical protein
MAEKLIQVGNSVIAFPDTMSDEQIGNILSGKSSQPQPAQEQSGGIGRQLGLTARAAYEGFTSPATAVLEAGRGLYNVGANLVGSESRIPSFAQAQSQNLTNVGVPEPQNAMERAVQAGAQGMASTAGLAAVAPAIAKALPAAAQAIGEAPATAALTENMARQIPAAAAGGAAGQATYEGMKNMGSSDLSATLASVGIGALAAGAAGRMGGAAMEGKGPTLYSMDEVKQRARASYARMDDQGIAIKPESTANMFTTMKDNLAKERLVMGSEASKEVMASVKAMEGMAKTPQISFTQLEEMRKTANDLLANPKTSRFGRSMVDTIDSYITKLNGNDITAGKEGLDKAVSSVMSARKDWRNASRAEALNDALDVATIKAELGNKGSEAEFLRQGITRLATNKDKMKLFSKEEQNILKSVAKGGPLDPLLTGAASFSPLRSKLSAAGEAYTFASNPQLAATVAGGGMAADALQNYLKRQAAQEAVKRIASGQTAPTPPNMAYRGLLTGGMVPTQGQ